MCEEVAYDSQDVVRLLQHLNKQVCHTGAIYISSAAFLQTAYGDEAHDVDRDGIIVTRVLREELKDLT